MISIVKNFTETESILTSAFDSDIHSMCFHNWAPGIFEPNYRKKSNFKMINILALDVDGGCTIKEAKRRFDGFNFALLPTKNHQKPKHGIVEDRFRVVIPLNNTCTDRKQYAATWNFAAELWPFIDPACKDESRFYYPSTSIAYYALGNPFPLQPVRETSKRQAPEVERNINYVPGSVKNLLMFGTTFGSRNNTIFRASCDLFRAKFTLEEVSELLRPTTDLEQEEFVRAINSALNAVSE